MSVPNNHIITDITESDYRSEQIKVLYAGLPSSIAVNQIVGGVFAWLMADTSGQHLSLLWYLILTAVMSVRVVIWYLQSKSRNPFGEFWFKLFRITVTGSGAVWALASLLLFPENNIPYQAFIAFALAGMTAGAIAALAMDIYSILLFIIPSLLSLIVHLVAEGSRITITMGSMTAFFLLFSVIIARRLNRNFMENVRLRIALHEREIRISDIAARLNEAQRLAHVGSFDWNLVTGELKWSDEHFRLWGYEPGKIIPDYEVFRKGVHPDDIGRLEEVLQKALAGEQYYNCFHRVVKADGTILHIHGRGEVIFDPGKKPTSMIGTVEDITERVKIEEELVLARDEARQANQAKSEFLSSMSHEIRTPMNAMLGFTQLMNLDEELTPDQKQNVNEILKSGSHLLDLVNDVLDLSRIESGSLEYKIQEVDPVKVLKECLTLVDGMAKKRNIIINLNARSDKKVLADDLRLKQILLNLLSNAVKYNREGGSVTIELVSHDDSYMEIEVADTGQGISLDKMDHLFEPFHRLGAEKSNIEGTGIGLVITKNIIEKMNGRIQVESREGEGSSFRVTFPLA